MSQNDEVLLHRFLDGELDAAAAAAFRARMAAEPALRQRVGAEQQARGGFAAARGDVAVAPVGSTAGVLAAVRRLPSRDQIEREELGDRIVRLCRNVLLAAAVLFGLGLLLHSGLFESRSDKLEAAPDEIRRVMDELDAGIRAGEADRGPVRPDPARAERR